MVDVQTLQLVVAALGHPVLACDAGLNVLQSSEGAVRLLSRLGASGGAVSGASLVASLNRLSKSLGDLALEQAAAIQDGAESAPLERVLADGTPLQVRVCRLGAFIGVELTDFTPQRQMEQQRRQSQGQAIRHHAAMASLIGSAALWEGRVDDVVVQVTQLIANTLDVARVGVWWLRDDDDGGVLQCADVFERRGERHMVLPSLSGDVTPRYFQALRSGDTIIAGYAQSDPRTREFTESYLVPAGITSMLDAPIRVGGRVVGVICHEHVGAPRTWTLEEQQLASFAAHVVALARETADRRAAQREADSSRVFLDSIVEHLPLMVFVKDAEELRFLRFNRAGEQLLGIARSELLGRSDRDLFPPEQAEFFVQRDREALDSPEPIDVPSEPIVSRTLGPRVLHTRKIAIRDAAGVPRYLLGISEDITP